MENLTTVMQTLSSQLHIDYHGNSHHRVVGWSLVGVADNAHPSDGQVTVHVHLCFRNLCSKQQEEQTLSAVNSH